MLLKQEQPGFGRLNLQVHCCRQKGDLEERRRPFGPRDVGAAVFMRLQQ